MSTLTVFISSTFLEFKEERKLLQKILATFLGVGCNMAESLTCQTPNLKCEIDRWIKSSDIVVLLLGIRYGSTHECVSWTETEIISAIKQQKKILVYMKEQSTPNTIADLDLKKQKFLNKFIQFIEKKCSPNIPRFADEKELIALVVRDIQAIIQKQIDVKEAQDEKEIHDDSYE